MMSIEDYALDVNKTVDEILSLCDKIGISYDDLNTMLSDTDITLLDNQLQNESEDDLSIDDEELQEKLDMEKVIDKAEELALDTNFDLDNSNNFEKVKKNATRKSDNGQSKKDFMSMRKKMYKNRENLRVMIKNKMIMLLFIRMV